MIGYCLNVHPGETLEEVLAAFAGPVTRVRVLRGEVNVGLYLAAAAAREVRGSEEALDRLRASVARSGARVFTANAFPTGGFHAETVKRLVYQPTWMEEARLRYTLDVAVVMASLLPAGARASISTSPVSYRAFPAPDLARAGARLRQVAEAFEQLEAERGVSLALAIEPEPNATFERATELARFLEEHVFRGDVERRRIGACLDACHHAVAFEPIEEALATYRRAGVKVAKAQLSSALELAPRDNPEGVARLRGFAEPRYLHQTFWSREGRVGSVEDLPLAFDPVGLREPFASADLVRSHVHVPLAWEGDRALGTTRHLLARALRALLEATDQLEVETYTWSVLPEATRAAFQGDVARMVAAELAWVESSLQSGRRSFQ